MRHIDEPLVLKSVPRDGIVQLTLNRPEKLNAISYAMADTLSAHLARIVRDEQVRAVVVTGAGRAFSAGADIVEFRHSMLDDVETAVREFCRRGQQLTATIESFPKPVVAAVNGLAYGGGCEIVEATHVTVAAASATFAKPEIALGIVPTFGGTQRLPRLVGRKRALHAVLSGEPFGADAAQHMGLVNVVVPDDEVLPAAIALAESYVRHSAVAVRACLAAVTRGLNVGIDEGLHIEANQFAITAASDDAREGTSAFADKRVPRFTGR